MSYPLPVYNYKVNQLTPYPIRDGSDQFRPTAPLIFQTNVILKSTLSFLLSQRHFFSFPSTRIYQLFRK
jgi:hypothetical protein